MRSKKNKKKIIIAIVLGLVATISLFNSMNSQKAALTNQQSVINDLNKKIETQATNPFKEAQATAVVAGKDIKVGDVLVLEALALQAFDPKNLPPNFFPNKAMVVGKKAGKNIAKGGIITQAEIDAEDASSIDIPDNTRAVTIPTEKFSGLASHLRVGSRVDILKAAKPPEYIAQNIKIISFELLGAAPAAAPGAPPAVITAKNASAITFLVPTNIVSNIITSMSEGQLQIIARNNNDERVIISESELPPPPGAEIATIPTLPELPEQEEHEESLPQPAMPAPDPKKVEIIKASSVSTIEFDSNSITSNNDNNTNKESASDNKLKELLDLVN